MVQKEKKHLTLNVDSEIANKAVADPTINVSDITEKLLKAFTTSSKTADKEKLYEMYQELFDLMLPLLKKFRVNVEIGAEEVFDEESNEPGDYNPVYDEKGEVIDVESIPPSEIFGIYLESDGSFSHDLEGPKDFKDIDVNLFFKPQQIVDRFLSSILKGAEYRKNQFKEIEMAKTIIDAITKGVIPKSKKSKRSKRK